MLAIWFFCKVGGKQLLPLCVCCKCPLYLPGLEGPGEDERAFRDTNTHHSLGASITLGASSHLPILQREKLRPGKTEIPGGVLPTSKLNCSSRQALVLPSHVLVGTRCGSGQIMGSPHLTLITAKWGEGCCHHPLPTGEKAETLRGREGAEAGLKHRHLPLPTSAIRARV